VAGTLPERALCTSEIEDSHSDVFASCGFYVMIPVMGKKPKRKAKHAVGAPVEGELAAEAEYYARKCGITINEAAKIIREANGPKLSIVPKAKGK